LTRGEDLAGKGGCGLCEIRCRRFTIHLAPWTVLASSASVFLLGIDFLTDPPRPPEGVRESYTWLRTQAASEHLIAVDHTDWWQPVILIYGLSTPQGMLESYVNLGDQDAPGGAPDIPPPVLGSYLDRMRPAFVVRATRREGGESLGPAWTFLDAWSAEGRARLVLQNADVMVYALDWAGEE
jgi:hypothetical protein